MSLDLLVIGAHPDDAELGAAGLLHLASQRRWSTGIVCLTRGEGGVLGDATTRTREARESAELLRVDVFKQLDLGDTLLDTGRARLEAVEEVLLETRPARIVTHHPDDWNPDHRAAWTLVDGAWAAANRGGRHGARAIARPRLLQFRIDVRRAVPPTLVVDITSAWPVKERALACHASQAPIVEAAPLLARAWGALIGSERGEAFASPEAIALNDRLELG